MIINSGSSLLDVLQAISGTWLQEVIDDWRHIKIINIDVYTRTCSAGTYLLPKKPTQTSIMLSFDKGSVSGKTVSLNDTSFKLDASRLVIYLTIG